MYWGVPNPPGANPLVAERAPWRSSQSCVTEVQQPIGNPYRFLSFLLHTWQPMCDPNSHSWRIRKILVSVKVLSAILGPDMGAPILWSPGIFAFFLQENLHVHKIPCFRGGGILGFWGGTADFIFMGAGIFLREGSFSYQGVSTSDQGG